MTGAIVGGLVTDPRHKPTIYVSSRGQEKLRTLCERYSVNAATSNEEVINKCDAVVLSVKPQILQEVVTPLKAEIQTKRPLIISVAAGIHCETLSRWLGGNIPLVRAMPNMPSVIREGASGLFAYEGVSTEQTQLSENIFNSIGIVSWLHDESDIDKVTAVSGSGPAYFMLMIQCLIDAAVEEGMSLETAKALAVQTARGTSGMIAQSDKPLPHLIDDMLLPGGTTEQAVAALKTAGLPEAMKAAFVAARNRAQQLSEELSK